jgi:hypothetical protein
MGISRRNYRSNNQSNRSQPPRTKHVLRMPPSSVRRRGRNHTSQEQPMDDKLTHQAHFEMDDMNEKLRRDVMKNLEPYGQRMVTDLEDLTEGERAKWLFWNLHENLDAIRKLEPTLMGQIATTQFTISDGQSIWADKSGLEKRIELQCKWDLLLTFLDYQTEKLFPVGEGWVNLYVCNKPPSHPTLAENQRGYIDADSSLFPNQLFLHGWISEAVWQEIKPQFYTANPACRTSVVLLDSYLFPVKSQFDFVTGPAGAIGITNLEFQVVSHPTERRMARRTEPRQRS